MWHFLIAFWLRDPLDLLANFQSRFFSSFLSKFTSVTVFRFWLVFETANMALIILQNHSFAYNSAIPLIILSFHRGTLAKSWLKPGLIPALIFLYIKAYPTTSKALKGRIWNLEFSRARVERVLSLYYDYNATYQLKSCQSPVVCPNPRYEAQRLSVAKFASQIGLSVLYCEGLTTSLNAI